MPLSRVRRDRLCDELWRAAQRLQAIRRMDRSAPRWSLTFAERRKLEKIQKWCDQAFAVFGTDIIRECLGPLKLARKPTPKKEIKLILDYKPINGLSIDEFVSAVYSLRQDVVHRLARAPRRPKHRQVDRPFQDFCFNVAASLVSTGELADRTRGSRTDSFARIVPILLHAIGEKAPADLYRRLIDARRAAPRTLRHRKAHEKKFEEFLRRSPSARTSATGRVDATTAFANVNPEVQ